MENGMNYNLHFMDQINERSVLLHFLYTITPECVRFFRFWILYRAKKDGPVVLVSLNIVSSFLTFSFIVYHFGDCWCDFYCLGLEASLGRPWPWSWPLGKVLATIVAYNVTSECGQSFLHYGGWRSLCCLSLLFVNDASNPKPYVYSEVTCIGQDS